MKLKPVIRKIELPQEEPPKKPRKKSENRLPSDEYAPMFDPQKILVRETPSKNNPTKRVKQYIEISVKRFGGDDENAPMVYMQMYQESEMYTGYLKGKTCYFPLEMLYDIKDALDVVDEECEKRHIE